MFTAALQCTVVCQKPGAGVLGVGPVSSSNMAPSGWGQILACARICPPASHWMWRPTSPSWRNPCPESHSQHCSDYPAIILSLGYYLLFLFDSGIRLPVLILASVFQKTYALDGRKAFLFCLIVRWFCLQVTYTSHGTKNMDFWWHAAAFWFILFSHVNVWIPMFDHLVWK